MSYGSAGQGSLTHLAMEQFRIAAGFDAVHAAYRGIGPAITDILGGQTQMMMPGLAAAVPHIRAGKMKPLAVTGLKRHPLLPEVPTFEELGYKGFDGVQWYGIVGPAEACRAAVTKKLNDEINKAIGTPGAAEAALRRGARRHADDARAVRQVHAGRHRQVGEARPGTQHHAWKTDRWHATRRSRRTTTRRRSRARSRSSSPRIPRGAGATPWTTRRTAPSSTGWAAPSARARHEAAQAALDAAAMLQPAPQATVLGRAERVDMASAALVNGISSHTFDFDDTHLKTIIHPAGPVASALLALAEVDRAPRAGR